MACHTKTISGPSCLKQRIIQGNPKTVPEVYLKVKGKERTNEGVKTKLKVHLDSRRDWGD